jgi:tRNA threonylcarbamoyl adenosine modification protein YeaZ
MKEPTHENTPMSASMTVTLALDSSAGLASVAIAADGTVRGQTKVEAAHGHAAWIVPLMQDALRQARLGFDDVTAIIAGRGPGSFTGIRVALAAAKGLGLSLGLTPIGLSSLAALARHDADGSSFIISSIDSRRKTQYIQGFSPDLSEQTAIIDGTTEAMIALADDCGRDHDFIINGHDAHHHVQALTAAGFTARSGQAVFPLAVDLCRYHHDNLERNDGLEPLYLAPPLISHPSVQ